MKKLMILLLCGIPLPSLSADCAIPEGIGEARPLIQVGVPGAKKFDSNSCATIVFELKVKPNTEGKGLVPTKVRIFSTNDKKFSKKAKKIAKKWLFRPKDTDQDGEYYSILRAR